VAVALGALSAADEHDRGVDVAGRERDVDAGGHFVLGSSGSRLRQTVSTAAAASRPSSR